MEKARAILCVKISIPHGKFQLSVNISGDRDTGSKC